MFEMSNKPLVPSSIKLVQSLNAYAPNVLMFVPKKILSSFAKPSNA